MEWITLIVMLISYYLSAKSGKSKGQSAAIAAGAGLATYYATSPDGLNLLNTTGSVSGADGSSSLKLSGDGSTTKKGTSSTIGLNGIVGTTGDVLKSWGPTGTAAVIGTTALTTSGSFEKYLPYILLGVGAYLVLK